MTEQQHPDAAAALLRAAGRPAEGDELVGMAALVQQFSAQVTADIAAEATAPAALTPRSHSMLATRLTRRATAMVAITLLAAGTAAAAAGGVLPT